MSLLKFEVVTSNGHFWCRFDVVTTSLDRARMEALAASNDGREQDVDPEPYTVALLKRNSEPEPCEGPERVVFVDSGGEG